MDALIKASKHLEMMMLPRRAHGFGSMQEYFDRMLMEYFAEHLMGDYYRSTVDNQIGGRELPLVTGRAPLKSELI